MRVAGDVMGFSSSYVSQVENCRAIPLEGEALKKLLFAYGTEQKAFTRMMAEFNDEISDLEIIQGLLPKLSPEAVKTLRVLTEQLLSIKKAK